MYLTERQKRILSLLLASKEWMTGAEIGRRLGITDRTVRKDIREINESLKEYKGSHIDSIRGTGYVLKTKERKQILKYTGKGNENETLQGRISSLALEILTADEAISLDDLEEAFFISRTTLETAIRQINEKSIKYGLGTVIKHKRNMVCTECLEEERRKGIHIFLKRLWESRQIAEDEFGFLNKKEIQDIQQSVWKSLCSICTEGDRSGYGGVGVMAVCTENFG